MRDLDEPTLPKFSESYRFIADQDDHDKIAVMDDDGQKIWEGTTTEFADLLDLLRRIVVALTNEKT